MNIKSILLKLTVKNLKRAWRIYISPPKETKIFFNPKTLAIMTDKVSMAHTGLEPKQVAVDAENYHAYVSCMRGHVLQKFSYANDTLVFIREWRFIEQCVEVEIVEKLCFVTTTNFKRGKEQQSNLHIINLPNEKILSSVNTGGEWSKVIKVDHVRGIAYVSNWHSNNVSIIDVSDPAKTKVIQILPCSESPRGLVLRSDGAVVATSFFGRKIFTIEKVGENYTIIGESSVFDTGNYGGNMRDILFTPDGSAVWVSNLGRNMLLKYDAYTLELQESILIPREPNSMSFLDSTGKIIIVSARRDEIVCFVDTQEKRPIGVSQQTGKLPTGLAAIANGFLVTNFTDSTIELHKVKAH